MIDLMVWMFITLLVVGILLSLAAITDNLSEDAAIEVPSKEPISLAMDEDDILTEEIVFHAKGDEETVEGILLN